MNCLKKYDPGAGFDSEERCHIVELDNSADDMLCSIAEARVKPGVSTQLHRLQGVIERYVILQGEGVVDIGDQHGMRVAEKDVVIIPAGVTQRITNNGSSDLVFLCICTPRFTQDCYQAVE